MIAILDYDMGNLRSVSKALEKVGADCRVTRDPKVVAAADKLVVPGVGAFGDCMKNLREYGLEEPAKKFIKTGKPFLGICVGMQILMESSEESPGVSGMGILPGRVVRFSPGTQLKVPHMGWNSLKPAQGKPGKLLKELPEPSYVYFVHSYYIEPEQKKKITTAAAEYGVNFTAAIEQDNIHATQFHPEKSQNIGLKILKNFVDLK